MTKEALKLALEALHGFIPYLPLNDEAQCGRYDEAITAIKEALANEALEKMAENARELGLDYEPPQPEHGWTPERIAGMARLKEAQDKKLAQQEQPKVRTGNCLRVGVCASEGHKIAPQRTWVGLTEDEILSISADCASSHQHMDIHFARAIEAKLRSKNSG
jgi:hypothetical protein